MSILFIKYYQKVEQINTVVVLGSLVVMDMLVATIVALGRISIVIVIMVLSDNMVNDVIISIDMNLIMSHVLMNELLLTGTGDTVMKLLIVDMNYDRSESQYIIIGGRKAGVSSFTVGWKYQLL